MITAIEITARAPLVGGCRISVRPAPYERLDGIAIGELDPTHPANRGIVNIDKSSLRNARGMVEVTRSDIRILRPANPEHGNGRILYEVNNRGRMMLFANLLRRQGRQPTIGCGGSRQRIAAAARIHLAAVVRLGPGCATCQWRTWVGRADRHRRQRADRAAQSGEEFISGRRGGDLKQFRLTYEAATHDDAVLTVEEQYARRRRGNLQHSGSSMRARSRLAQGAAPEPGSIYELRYHATNPRRIGHRLCRHARHRQSSSQQRGRARCLLGRQPTHALGFWHLAGRALSARSHRARLQSRRRRRTCVRWHAHPCRRHRPCLLQHPNLASLRAPERGTRIMGSPRWNFPSPLLR